MYELFMIWYIVISHCTYMIFFQFHKSNCRSGFHATVAAASLVPNNLIEHFCISLNFAVKTMTMLSALRQIFFSLRYYFRSITGYITIEYCKLTDL